MGSFCSSYRSRSLKIVYTVLCGPGHMSDTVTKNRFSEYIVHIHNNLKHVVRKKKKFTLDIRFVDVHETQYHNIAQCMRVSPPVPDRLNVYVANLASNVIGAAYRSPEGLKTYAISQVKIPMQSMTVIYALGRFISNHLLDEE